MGRSARTNPRTGRGIPALLRRVRGVWGLRLWRQSTCRAARPLVLRRTSARSAAMNPLVAAKSLSDAARRMHRYRERRRYRIIEAIAGPTQDRAICPPIAAGMGRGGIPEFLRRTPNGAAP